MAETRLCTNCGTYPQTTAGKCECGMRHKYDWIGKNGTVVYLDRLNEIVKAQLSEDKTEEETTE